MTIMETEVIDLVAVKPGTNLVKLVVSDHLDWDDLGRHCWLLQEKINRYVAHIEAGQLRDLETPRIPEKAEYIVSVSLLHDAPPEATAFLDSVREFLANIGIAFEVKYTRRNKA